MLLPYTIEAEVLNNIFIIFGFSTISRPRTWLKIQLDKYEYLRPQLGYFGHVIIVDAVKLKHFKELTNQTETCSFLEVTDCYRKIIRNFAKIAIAVTDLKEKTKSFVYIDHEQVVFGTLKLVGIKVLQV
jgi:hypothetical protein